MKEYSAILEKSALGKTGNYDARYNPDVLFPIPRQAKRDEIGVFGTLPFFGLDIWNHYEVSWLNRKGKPMVAAAVIRYGCETPFIIESKSMKLYFNSLNNTLFTDVDEVRAIVKNDLEARLGGSVFVDIFPLEHLKNELIFSGFSGECIDELDLECSHYELAPTLLSCGDEDIQETLYSNLFRSNCPVTNQPDWASIQIAYTGKKINHEGLLQYFVSFRNESEFHEQCVERIFIDIMKYCHPASLSVYGRFTRRGGLDINAYRSSDPDLKHVNNIRLCRQ